MPILYFLSFIILLQLYEKYPSSYEILNYKRMNCQDDHKSLTNDSERKERKK